MTDRIKGFTVALTHDIRDDDCERIVDAIKMIKGVAGVAVHVADPSDYMARKQVKSELQDKIFEWFKSL